MARSIVRYSIDGEKTNATGNEARKILESAGFEKIGTASFEALDVDQAILLAALAQLTNLFANPPGGGRVDHLWVYLDEPEPS